MYSGVAIGMSIPDGQGGARAVDKVIREDTLMVFSPRSLSLAPDIVVRNPGAYSGHIHDVVYMAGGRRRTFRGSRELRVLSPEGNPRRVGDLLPGDALMFSDGVSVGTLQVVDNLRRSFLVPVFGIRGSSGLPIVCGGLVVVPEFSATKNERDTACRQSQ